MNVLTDIDRAILEFEAGPHWIWQGRKEDEIRQRFAMTVTAYTQRLNRLLDDPAALAYDPTTVNRLRRLRDTRKRRAG